MSMTIETGPTTQSGEVQFATFRVDDLLLGADIRQVEEINRHLEMTPVPHAPGCVRGVINLRGDVVTVVDLRQILGLGATELSATTRNVIVNSRDERIGLLVDRIGDVVILSSDEIDPPPPNLNGADVRLFRGVYRLDGELLVILDVEAVLKADTEGN